MADQNESGQPPVKNDENQVPAQNESNQNDKQDKTNKEEDPEKKPLIMTNPWAEKKYVASDVTDPDKFNLTPCCCCLCACSHDRVGSASCFGCFPIRCGIIFIGIFIFVLAITLLIVTFFGLLNEYLPWWFTFVQLLLLTPLIVSASIAVYFFSKDKQSTRGKLRGAAIMSIISVFLWAVWQLIFYLAIYKRDTVYSGMGAANDDSNYTRMGKKQYIFTFLAEAFVIMGFLAYFVAVTSEYVNLMNAPHELKKEEEAARLEQEKKDANK